MNKTEFLKRLQEDLTSLTEEERLNALKYYDEYFTEAKENDEIITDFTSTEDLANRIEEELAEIMENAPRADGIVLKLEPDPEPEEQPELIIEVKKEEDNNQYQPKYGVKNKSMTLLIIILCTFPIWLPLLIALTSAAFGLFIGLFAGVFGIAAAVIGIAFSGVAMIGAGIVSVGVGIFSLFTGTSGALFAIGSGFIAFGFGILIVGVFTKLAIIIVKSVFKFAGWTIRGISGRLSNRSV